MNCYIRAVSLSPSKIIFYSYLEARGQNLVLQYPSGRPHENYTSFVWWNKQADLKSTKVKELCIRTKWEF